MFGTRDIHSSGTSNNFRSKRAVLKVEHGSFFVEHAALCKAALGGAFFLPEKAQAKPD